MSQVSSTKLIIFLSLAVPACNGSTELVAKTQLSPSISDKFGQSQPEVCFATQASGYAAALTRDGLVIRSHHDPVRMRFGSRAVGACPAGVESQSNEPRLFVASGGLSGAFQRLKYSRLYPGIDLVFYRNYDQFEYDFLLDSGVSPSQIQLSFGRHTPEIEASGALRIGPVRWGKPFAYQEIGGARRPAEARYVLLTGGRIGFDVQGYDTKLPLVIDPVLEYASNLNELLHGHIAAVQVDGLGNTYVAGRTEGEGHPGGDAFVAKLDARGGPVWVSYLGGSSTDEARGLALDREGNLVVVGSSSSTDLPLSTPDSSSLKGSGGFLARLHPSDGRILESMLIGIAGSTANAVAISPDGSIFVTGAAVKPGRADAGAFVMKLDAAGARVEYVRHLRGEGYESGNALAVDIAGSAYVTGSTTSRDFPQQGGLQRFGGGEECFVTKFDSSGGVLYSTLLGGAGADRCAAIAVDAEGYAYVAGSTSSPDFPVQAASQPTWGGDGDGFVARLNPTGSAFVYSTYLGGAGADFATGIVLDRDRNAYVAGSTRGHFPGLEPTAPSDQLSFVAGIGPDGGPLLTLTDVGRGSAHIAQAIARDTSGSLYVAGDRHGDSIAPGVEMTGAVILSGGFVAKVSGKPASEVRRQARESENSAPAGPVLSPVLSPASLSPVVSWSPSAGATQYVVWVDVNPDPGSYIVRNVPAGQTSVQVGPLRPNQNYYWRVYAVDGSGGASSSAVGFFTTVQSDGPVLHPSSFLPLQGPEHFLDVLFEHPNGADAYERLYLLVGPTLKLSEACYVSYHVATNRIYLLNDAANDWGSPATPGVATTLQNSQCVIDLSLTTITRTSGQIHASVRVRRKAAFYGRKEVYLYATTAGGGSVDWRYLNTWNDWPQLGPVVPNSGLGTSVGYSVTYPFRPDQVTGLYVLINAGLDARSACYISATPGGVLSILDDTGVNWSNPGVAGAAVSLQNSQCILDLRTASVSTSADGITLRLPLTFKPSFSGTRRVFLMSRTTDRGDTDWQFAAVWTVGAQYGPPIAGPVSPSSGSGVMQKFTVSYTNPGGATALDGAFLLMNGTWSPVNSCAVYYHPATSLFYVLDDTGNSWANGRPAGSGTLRSSQCILNLANSSATANGTTLTLNLDLQFLGSFAGTRQMYVLARSPSGDTGWQYGGQWTVPAASALSVGPASSAPFAEKTLFTLHYTNPAGANQLTGAFFLMNSELSAVAGCVVYYVPQTGRLFLLNDSGTDWGTPTTLGGGTLSNSQCRLHASASSVSSSGPVLTLNLALTFETRFRGLKQVSLLAQSAGLETPWQQVMTYTVETPLGPVIPSSGSGASQVFTAQYWHPQGGAAYNSVFFRMASSDIAANSCIVYYSRVGGAYFLLNDAGTSYGAGGIGGTATYLENSQCRLDLSQTSATITGNLLSVRYALEFKGAFAGPKKIYLTGQAPNVSSATWTEVGTWTAFGASVSAVLLSPALGEGATQAFSAKYAHPSGPSALTGAFLLLRSNATLVNACAVYYHPTQQLFFLLNDAGSDWGLGMRAGAGTLQNSQCVLDLARSSAVADSSSVTVNFGLSFKAAFQGNKNVFLLARSTSSETGWLQAGTWTVPFAVGAGIVTPDGSTGSRQIFNIAFTAPTGAQIQGGFFLVNSSLAAPNACVVYYAPALGRVFLLNDAASSWGDGGIIGAAGVLENSQCALNVGTSSAGMGNGVLNLGLDLSFKPTFRGTKGMYLLLRTGTDDLGWYESGSWIVP